MITENRNPPGVLLPYISMASKEVWGVIPVLLHSACLSLIQPLGGVVWVLEQGNEDAANKSEAQQMCIYVVTSGIGTFSV